MGGGIGERNVAIKVPPSDQIAGGSARLRSEARILRQLNHESIPWLIEYRCSAERSALIMHHIDGVTLEDLLDEWGRIPAPLAALIGRDVASALTHAHGRHIAHNDVSPSNVMVGLDGRVWLIDWGVAIASPRANLSDRTMGKPLYMAPEARAGQGRYASDVYSLGVLLYEMLTGRLPWGDGERTTTVRALPGARKSMASDYAARVADIDQADPIMAAIVVEAMRGCVAARPTARRMAARLGAIVARDSRAGLSEVVALCG